MNTAALRLLLALAYPLLAHLASSRGSGGLAAVALADIAAIVLLQPLLTRRPWAWVVAALLAVGLAALAQSRYAQLPLLLVPVAFVALVSWAFARTLRAGRVPLISKIVAALEHKPATALEPRLHHYTRRLTAAWALLLAALALANLVLALLAVPNGLLASFGAVPPITVSERQWSWFANLLNYGLVAGFFIGEYALRRRWFPNRPYRNFAEFLRQMGALGPEFWRTLLR